MLNTDRWEFSNKKSGNLNMERYKKIIPKGLRFGILRMLKFIPDRTMLKIQYRLKTGRKLSLDSPVRYSEKIQWYKLYYRNELMTVLADKYRVREYLNSKGESGLAVKLYGVWESPEKIRFEDLPEKFILKTTNGSGTNIVCTDKSKFDENSAKAKMKSYFRQSKAHAGREWAYYRIKPRVIAEELLTGDINSDAGITDYKFFCFNGSVKYIIVDTDRYAGHKRNILDRDWKDSGVECQYPRKINGIKKPDQLDSMIEKAEKLSSGFPAVRVDLYFVAGKIYFGEMTFYPFSGYVNFRPDNFDYKLGSEFILPER